MKHLRSHRSRRRILRHLEVAQAARLDTAGSFPATAQRYPVPEVAFNDTFSSAPGASEKVFPLSLSVTASRCDDGAAMRTEQPAANRHSIAAAATIAARTPWRRGRVQKKGGQSGPPEKFGIGFVVMLSV